MTSVIDTNIISALMHLEDGIVDRVSTMDPSSLVLCAPVAAEIHFGLGKLVQGSKRHRFLERQFRMLRSAMRWADWGERAAQTFGSIKVDLRRKGLPIEDFDIAIGAIALELDASVVTRNVEHFERIDGLAVDNWAM